MRIRRRVDLRVIRHSPHAHFFILSAFYIQPPPPTPWPSPSSASSPSSLLPMSRPSFSPSLTIDQRQCLETEFVRLETEIVKAEYRSNAGQANRSMQRNNSYIFNVFNWIKWKIKSVKSMFRFERAGLWLNRWRASIVRVRACAIRSTMPMNCLIHCYHWRSLFISFRYLFALDSWRLSISHNVSIHFVN